MNLTSSMIEFSERVGQQSIAYGTRLPKRSNDMCRDVMAITQHIKRPSHTASREEWDVYFAEVNITNEAYTYMRYQNLGIEIVAEQDDMFYEAVLPEGWQVKSHGDSAYWSDLVAKNGERIGSIFYKAAFYDRRAFINFERGYYDF